MCIRDRARAVAGKGGRPGVAGGRGGVELVAGRVGAVVVATVPVSYTHLRAHETVLDLVCRLLLEKKK